MSMELEELRQRLLLRSKSADIPPIPNPVQVPEISFGHTDIKPIKWDTSLAPDALARLGNNGRQQDSASGAAAQHASKEETPVESAALPSKSAEPVKNVENGIASEVTVDGASSNGKTAALPIGSSPAEPISMLAKTADQLHEPTAAFREQFADLSKLLAPIDAATQSTEQALKRIAGLHEHLSGLANAFQSVKAFAEQVKTLSATFDPMKGLNDQLAQLIETFYLNVKELGGALEPVKAFQLKVRQLATTLDSINDLDHKLTTLAEAFRPAEEKPVQPATAVVREEKAAPVSQAA